MFDHIVDSITNLIAFIGQRRIWPLSVCVFRVANRIEYLLVEDGQLRGAINQGVCQPSRAHHTVKSSSHSQIIREHEVGLYDDKMWPDSRLFCVVRELLPSTVIPLLQLGGAARHSFLPVGDGYIRLAFEAVF